MNNANEEELGRLKEWLERLTEIVAKIEITVKMNYPLAIQEAVNQGKKCLSCGYEVEQAV